jgi:hypothetical protein
MLARLAATIILAVMSCIAFAQPFNLEARGTVCNANPDARWLILYFKGADPSVFLDRLAVDPAWRASLGNLTPYPPGSLIADRAFMEASFDPLVDPYRLIEALLQTGHFASVTRNLASCGLACGIDSLDEAIEYRRTDRDRYIFVTDPAERDALDIGAIGGWARTGESMRVITKPANPTAREGEFHPVYRFWGGSVTYEPSHFFTASQQECAVLRDRPEWNWTFERSGFWAYEWKSGGCPSGVPLYRTYNNGLDGAPAHRYSTKRSVIDEMVARGWVDEGPVMCVAGP